MKELFLNQGETIALELSNVNIVASIAFALALSAVMFFTFREVHNKMTYDVTFNVMLVMLSLITTIIMIVISSNVAMSLGMVGSLSLVRFRTNIRDNRDIGFVFWAMLIGLASANRAYLLGLLSTILLAIILILSSKKISSGGNMLMVIRGHHIDLDEAIEIVDTFTSTYTLKAQNLLEDSFELVFEYKSSPEKQNNMAKIFKTYEGVDSVNILAPSADMTA